MEDRITWRLGNEKVGKLLMSYAIPAVIGTVVNALYHIVNRAFIGQEVGAVAISGLTVTFPILMFLQAFGMLVGAGASARVSIHLGRKDNDRAENVLGNAFMLMVILNGCTIPLSLYFVDDLLEMFGGSVQTIPYAMEYLHISIPGNMLASISFGLNAVMRASGYPKKAMYIMLLGAVINVVLDYFFVFVFGWGISGAAYATIISMSITSVLVLLHFFGRSSIIRFRKKYFKLNPSVVGNIFTIGMSPFAMQMAGSLVNIVMNKSLKSYGGDLAIGASGIINSYALLIVMLLLGISQGMQPIVGFNQGAGNMKRVYQTLKLVIITGTIITCVGSLCCYLFPHFIVRIFTSDAELLSISANGLRICLSAGLIVGSQVVISQFFQSIGFAWKAMFLTLSRQCIFLIPAIIILPRYFDLDGVWVAMPFSDIIAGISAWVFLFFHYVKHRE